MKKRMIPVAVLALAVGTSTLTACGSDTEEQKGKITIASAGMSPNSVAPFLAESKGYFEKRGVEVDIVTIEPGTDLAQLSAGDVDLVLGGVSAGLMNAVSAGTALRWVAPGYEIDPETRMGMYVRSKFLDASGKLVPSRLKGATLAISAPGGLQDSTILRAIAGSGVEYEDLNIQKMAAGDIFAAIESGKVDGGFLVPPFFSSLTNKDYKLGMRPILPSYAAYVAGPSAAKKKDEIVNFFCAIKDVHRDVLKQGYTKDATSLKALTDLLEMPEEAFTADPTPNLFNPDLRMDGAEEYLTQLQEVLIPTGFLQYDDPVDPKEFIDRQYIEADCA